MTSVNISFIAAVVLICAAAVVSADDGLFHFLSIGDWGCMPMGGEKANDEKVVAKNFAAKAADLKARFILNSGDNVYHCGVHSKSDSVWNSTFENVFTNEATMVPWYSCLGNHDYGYPGSAEGEMEYVSPKHNRWVLPARYYHKRLVFPGEVNISLVVLDSSPCQKAYRDSNPDHWDPCGTHTHTCPGCTFHENVIKQNCTEQLVWLKNLLPTIPKDDWRIVMTHAPAYSLDVEDLLTPLQEAKFELFINGHVHVLAHYEMDGNKDMNFVTTGAGCWVNVADHPAPKTDETCHAEKHTCKMEWKDVVAGYTEHVFEDSFKTLATHYYNAQGDRIHRIAVTKRS